jgi:hypothetical protein
MAGRAGIGRIVGLSRLDGAEITADPACRRRRTCRGPLA